MSVESKDMRLTIIRELAILQKKEQAERNVFKARAYGKVIAQLKAMDDEHPIYTMDDVATIDGIGEKIRLKIQEILETGHLEAAEKLREDDTLRMMDVLTHVYGIGPVKAKTLLQQHSVKDIDAFRKVVEENPDLLHEKQKIGLKYYEDFLLRIPRREMLKHESRLMSVLKGVSDKLHGDIVGSFRRGAKDSGDIDLLIGYPAAMKEKDAVEALKEFVHALQKHGYIKEELAFGPKKFMGVCKLPRHTHARRLDILLTGATEYPFALLYFTGSDKYNIQIRKHALSKGYTLNEHGLKPVQHEIPEAPTDFQTEQDIVRFLDLEYIPPSQRV